ncbi:MAG: DNA primase, partial [bacterium]|nr:DNA primase [bacterium]
EKTPSFVVFPDSQHWHCFGACGEGGDVLSFVMKREGWDFRTALEELARRAGVELKPRTPAQVKAEQETDRLHGLLEKAARYYNQLLHHAPQAQAVRAYVARRGLNDETIDRFLVGYSLPGWDGARAYLTERGYTVGELVKAGLLVQRDDRGSTYDRFRDRLMITIRDGKGRVIGFGARTLDPEGVPKYLNSPQTALFDKSRTLFGLDLARQAIRREDRAIIVEGYMDVMQAQQAGFANVVAQMGTALTEAQLRQLERLSKRLVLALDPDTAGIRATLRGVKVARETLEQEWEPVFDPRGLVGHESRMGADIRILQLPHGQDPDDLIREDAERWTTLVEEAVPVVDFYLKVLMEGLDLDDSKAKSGVVDTLLPILRAVSNPVEREDHVQKIARVLRVDVRAVQSRLRGAEQRKAQRQPSRSHDTPRVFDRGPGAVKSSQGIVEADLEGHCLAAFLQRPGLLAQVNAALETSQQNPLHEQDFRDAGCRAIFEAWETLLATGNVDPVQALRTQLPDELDARLEKLLAANENDLLLADEQLE